MRNGTLALPAGILTTISAFETRRKHLQDLRPSSIHRSSHLSAARAHALKVSMCEIHACHATFERSEAYLDFACFCQIRIVGPLVGDHPGQNQKGGRLPYEDLSPIAFGPIFVRAVAASTWTTFNCIAGHRRLTDVVGARPPAIMMPGEDLESTIGTRFHGHGLENRLDRGGGFGHDSCSALLFEIHPGQRSKKLVKIVAQLADSLRIDRIETPCS